MSLLLSIASESSKTKSPSIESMKHTRAEMTITTDAVNDDTSMDTQTLCKLTYYTIHKLCYMIHKLCYKIHHL